MKRIVITGLGMINALGRRDESFAAILRGDCGIDTITLCETADLVTTIAAEVKDFDPTSVMSKRDVKKTARYIQLGLAAAEEALEDARLLESNLDNFGVVTANGMGGMDIFEKAATTQHTSGLRHISPFFIPGYLSNMLGGHLSIKYTMHGPNLSISTACAAGTHAISEACKTIRSGLCDAMLVVGAESTITPLGISGFNSMNTLSKQNERPKEASRPFDKQRSGFVMGEGAGALVVETLEHAQERGATIYAEVTGFGESADAYHITTPHSEGVGAKKAIVQALNMAGVQSVDYINAHGTSTRYNDLYEASVIAELFGEGPLVSSTKGQIGHCLGAAGAIEAVITIMSLQHNVVPPVINYSASEEEMASINLVVNEGCEWPLKTALSCNFGFGGTNAAVIFSKLTID